MGFAPRQRAAFHAVLLGSMAFWMALHGESPEPSGKQEAGTSDFSEKIVRAFVADVDAGRQDACLERFANEQSVRTAFLAVAQREVLLKGEDWQSELSSMSVAGVLQDKATARFLWHRVGMLESPENHGEMEVTVQEFSCQLEAVRKNEEWRFTVFQAKCETEAWRNRVAARIEEDLKRAALPKLSNLEKASVCFMAAYEYITIKRFESAETAARRSLAFSKTYHGHFTLGVALKGQRRFAEAREQFAAALPYVDSNGQFAKTAEKRIQECSEQEQATK